MNRLLTLQITRWLVVTWSFFGLYSHTVSRADVPSEAQSVGRAQKPKYYFKIVEVTGFADKENEEMARDLVAAALSKRPEFIGTLEGLPSDAQLVEALRKQKLRGFEVSLRAEAVGIEKKEPRPGSRQPQLAVSIKLTLYGSEIPTKKLAFSGSGEAMQIAEVIEKRLVEETKGVTRDVMTDAIAQAIEQAVFKLSLPNTSPGPLPAKKVRKKKGQG